LKGFSSPFILVLVILAIVSYVTDIYLVREPQVADWKKVFCREIGLEPGEIILGHEIEDWSEEELGLFAEQTMVFAKMNPLQKGRAVRALKARGHTVGFLGDGINDAIALRDSIWSKHRSRTPALDLLCLVSRDIVELLCGPQLVKLWYLRRFKRWL
jgi:hypothetical protein